MKPVYMECFTLIRKTLTLESQSSLFVLHLRTDACLLKDETLLPARALSPVCTENHEYPGYMQLNLLATAAFWVLPLESYWTALFSVSFLGKGLDAVRDSVWKIILPKIAIVLVSRSYEKNCIIQAVTSYFWAYLKEEHERVKWAWINLNAHLARALAPCKGWHYTTLQC